MRRMRAWLNAMLTQWRQRRRVEHELDDELHYHVAQETAANVARGLAPDEARRAALRDLGGLTQTRDSVRDVRATWIDRRTGDVRVAWRHLVRDARAHTLLVTATLAVGDLVWFRHAKSGEPFEHGTTVLLAQGDRFVDAVPSYRGHGLAF